MSCDEEVVVKQCAISVHPARLSAHLAARTLPAQFYADCVPHDTQEHQEFVREYDLEHEAGTIYLAQRKLGDESCVVWDAALVLAKYVEILAERNENQLKNHRVVELGAGLGLVGLVASFYGADVTLTDLPSVIDQLTANVERNKKLCHTIRVQALDWSKTLNLEPFSLILFADCVYYMESVEPLVTTMRNLSSASTDIYFAQEDRSYSDLQTSVWKYFVEQVLKYFKISKISLQDQHSQFSSPDIHVFHLKKILD